MLTLCCALSTGPIEAGFRPTQAEGNLGEYQVKAGFLINFAKFVEWPPEVMEDPTVSLTFCIAGSDPFHGELDRIVQGKKISNHPLEIVHLSRDQTARSCHILFISFAEKKRIPQILAELASLPVLTVGESDGFLQQGGTIDLIVIDERVKFDVNLESATKAGLKVSSRLLILARSILGHSQT